MQPVSQVLAAETTESSAPPAANPPAIPQEQLSTSGPEAPESEKIEPIENGVTETSPVEDAADEVTEPAEEAEDSEEEETSTEGLPEPPPTATVELPPSTVKQKMADADIASGALVYDYALLTPPGRAGMQSNVSLSYNSKQNDEGSLVGYGWGLNFPTIERKNVDGLNKIFTSENFTSSADGDLKKISSTQGIDNFGAKIDNGNYLKYLYNDQPSGGLWTVVDKTGMVYTYGATAESQLSNPADSTQVFRWYLTRTQDLNGNFVSYEYTKVDDQVYLSEIKYTGYGNNPGIFTIRFNLEDRPDKALSAKYGFLIKTSKRIASVEVLMQNIVIGRYSLSYNQQSVNRRSQLTAVEYTGYDIEGNNGISDGGTQFSYNSIGATDLLTNITQNTGGRTIITYKSSAQYFDTNGVRLNPNLPFAMQTVEKIEYDDRNGVTWENNFVYAGGWFYYNGPMDRRFVGFEKVVRTDSVGNTITTFYHQGNGTNAGYDEVADDWAKAGKLYKTELRDNQGDLYTQAWNKWEFNRLAGANSAEERSFVKLTTTITRVFDGNETHKDKASTYTYNAENGNLVSAINWGDVSTTGTKTFADAGADKLTTNVTYATSVLNDAIVGLPSGYIELNQAGNKVQEGRTYYDGMTFGLLTAGNPTKEQNWISGSTYAEVNREFNIYGLPLTETDPLGNSTSYTYDSAHMYPVSVSNALSQETTYKYDYRLGKAFKTVDPNGLANKITYDGLGRVTKEEFTLPGQNDPDVLVTKKIASYELYEQDEEVRGWKTTEINYLDDVYATSPRENKSIIYTDGFDRVIQTRSQVESDDSTPTEPRFSVSDTVYNAIAQIEKTSLPYFSTGEDRTTVSSNPDLFATLSYDSVYRIISSADAVGTTTNAYDDRKVTTTDTLGKVKELYKDAFDRLIKVDEHSGTETYTTEYSYDAEGNLIKVIDALSNQRNFQYDGLGRRILAEDLHDKADETYGIWEYEYDLAGNLITRLDPNGNSVSYDYDELNRVSSETDSGTSATVTYTYDTCDEGIGRLCDVTNSALTQSIEYNVLGQVIAESKTIDSQTFVTEYNYDRQGNQLGIKNPDGSEIKYAYNIGAAIETVQAKEESDKHFSDVVIDIDYAPTGAVEYLEQANGGKVTNTYDATKLYRLATKIGTLPDGSSGTKTVQDYTYTYDAVGNIVTIVDNSDLETRKQMDYAYDDLYRLTSAVSRNAGNWEDYTHTYEYDALGNITYRSDVGYYSYEGDEGESYANPHAVTKITSEPEGGGSVIAEYSYDHNGNMLGDGRTEYHWDYNNRISSILVGDTGQTVEYGYDSGGMRVKVANPSATTLYPSRFYNTHGAMVGDEVQKHIFAGDNLVATIKGSSGNAQRLGAFNDHLGSTTVMSDASGEVVESTDYYPFGSVRTSNESGNSGGPEQRKFIGQEYDVDTKLSYLEARYYDGELGRFLSEDAVHLSLGDLKAVKNIAGVDQIFLLTDPQVLNSYSYARNNPIVLRDKTGLIVETVFDVLVTGLSLRDFYRNPTVWNGIALGLDVIGFAAPGIPSLVGYARHGVKAAKISTYFYRVSKETGIPALSIAKTFLRDINFSFSRRGWSVGEATDSLGNLIGHFAKHGHEFGAKTPAQYYKKANDFIDSGQGVKLPTQGDRVEIWDAKTNTLAVTNADGTQLKTFHKVTVQDKINSYNNRLRAMRR